MSSSSKNPQVYVGGLSRRTRTEDLEKSFGKYGKIRDISIKGKYAFIEYDDYHGARDAVDRMDGRTLDGEKISVEPTKGRGRRGPSPHDKCWTCNGYGHWQAEIFQTEGLKITPRLNDQRRLYVEALTK
ncbi:hypothetical protein FGO68_gene9071 [Halteria grandinella]|uniref:RRM domain-containing protein n=1 Tax=Halteria grandinella TaxID=5974 RepID=A0A8J8SV78_HALGN|nr:hypothetical protein FGO68_gene9071 [Halteria grandinella]